MDKIFEIGRIILGSLLGFQFIILLFRFSKDRNLKEFIFFTLILLFVGIKGFLPGYLWINFFTSLLLINLLGNYLFIVTPVKKVLLWNLSCFFLGFFDVLIFRYFQVDGIIYPLYYFFSMMILLLLPMFLLSYVFRQSRNKIFRVFIVIIVLFVCSKTYDMLSFILYLPRIDASLWTALFMIFGAGYMLFQQGYLLNQGLFGFQKQIQLQEQHIQEAMAKLFQTETTLLVQDRLVTSGILAAGAAHEFKNILSNIRLNAQYGLQVEEDEREEVIRAILLNADQGFESVNRYMDMVILREDEEKCRIQLPQDIDPILKLMRVSLRHEGVSLNIHQYEHFSIKMGKGEFLQVLMNLIRNALSALKDNLQGDKIIDLFFKQDDQSNIIMVKDNGCGIPDTLKETLFDPNCSATKSSGLGLYLSKKLVQRNSGTIRFQSLERGTLFQLVFPRF
ncbi:MAG: GHKL domain-containing protein [Spirochaetales bacterium]|nr:GHKL domain-containing protein [Spirochaetales bacterium]